MATTQPDGPPGAFKDYINPKLLRSSEQPPDPSTGTTPAALESIWNFGTAAKFSVSTESGDLVGWLGTAGYEWCQIVPQDKATTFKYIPAIETTGAGTTDDQGRGEAGLYIYDVAASVFSYLSASKEIVRSGGESHIYAGFCTWLYASLWSWQDPGLYSVHYNAFLSGDGPLQLYSYLIVEDAGTPLKLTLVPQ